MSDILLLNGPNLNLLGTREPDVYGTTTLAEIEQDVTKRAADLGHRLHCYQSNHEGELVDRIQKAGQEGIAFILINAAGFTHTSVALRDALAGAAIPFIEVHLSNVYAREDFRHHSHLSAIAKGVIVGLGPIGYGFALHAAHQQLTGKS